jgi:hypothetical protein
MTKRKHKRERAELFHALTQQAQAGMAKHAPTLAAPAENSELTKMKKFRFQLLHDWIIAHIPPGRVADVGGGKGLLAYLLQQSGWEATVIDPIDQSLPSKYKDLRLNRRVKIAASETVPRINREFAPAMAAQFDLLVSMHAHGCNSQLIDVAAVSQKKIILLPCCIIQEPLLPAPGQHWIECVLAYALAKNLAVEPFRLNFRGQNIGLYIHSAHLT